MSGTPATPPRGRSGTPPAFVEGLAYRALPDARRSQSDINAKRATLLIQTERRDT